MSETKVNLEKNTEAPVETKVNLEKNTEAPVETKVDSFNNSVNNMLSDAGEQINKSLEKVDLGLNNIDMEKVREAEMQAEQSVQESLNSTTDSLQQRLDAVNNGFEKFYDSLGDGNTPVKPSELKVDPMSSAVLSFLFNGIGQIVNGQTRKGLVMFIVSFLANVVIGLFTCFIGLLVSMPVISIICAYDAYKCAKMLEEGKEISKDKLWFQYK